MTAWREAMNADILAFFDIDDPDATVTDIDVDQQDRGTCQTCRWMVFVVEVTMATRSGAHRRTYEGSIADFLTAVSEASERRREAETADDADAQVDARGFELVPEGSDLDDEFGDEDLPGYWVGVDPEYA